MGIIDLFRAVRSHRRSEALAVAVIFFVLMPAFALWARRLPSSGEENNHVGVAAEVERFPDVLFVKLHRFLA
jgi:hypothetical protein